jgi:hypothetical protein
MRFLWPVLFFILLMISSCEKSTRIIILNRDLMISDLNNSGCKNQLRSAVSTESIHFKMLNEGKLLIEHSNTFFNCAPGRITVHCEIIPDNHINIYEDEEKNDANCICPYDLSYSINGINAGEKTLSIYLMNVERLTYTLNLTNSTDTLILITD